PLLSFSSFLHQKCLRLGNELATKLGDTTRALYTSFPPPTATARRLNPPPFLFASVSQANQQQPPPALSTDYVAKRLTTVYTVSNTNNEFVLISDPDGAKSIGLLCFRQEDAEAFMSQVRLRRKELQSGAKVVPITPEQVYMLKVEGIAFRFLQDPVQIKNALELKASDIRSGFDRVPVFQVCCLPHYLAFPLSCRSTDMMSSVFVGVVDHQLWKYCHLIYRMMFCLVSCSSKESGNLVLT
ncbi:unnamed protein product, partial [Linum tenue]